MILNSLQWGEGQSKAAVMIHGGRDSATTWKEVGPWLAEQGYHAIALDMPGHGGSIVSPTHEKSLSRIALDVIETIASILPERAGIDLLIGHSLGGLASLTLVAEHPQFVGALVVEDTPGRSFLPAKVAENTAAQIRLARSHPNPAEVLPERDCVTPAQLAAKVEAAKATDPDYLPALMRTFADADIDALVARARLPTLVIVGKDYGEPMRLSWPTIKDYSLLSGSDRVSYLAALQQGQLVEIERVGHYVHTLAFPEFVAALQDWLPAA